jgi:ABC-type multidrug transport system fused ATPase/permease subunit
VIIIQIGLGFLDLFGVAIMGIVGLITIKGVQSQSLSGTSLKFIEFFKLSNSSFQVQVAILGSIAASALIIRSVLSIFFTWKITNFLAYQSASISNNLISKVVARGAVEFQYKNLSEMQHILGPGVSAIAVGVLSTIGALAADLSSTILISIAIILIDPLIGSISIILFSGIGIFLYFGLRHKIESYGKEFTNYSINVSKSILELITGYRQIFLGNRIGYYLRSISENRERISKLYAINSFLPGLGKYIIEIAIILGGLIVAASLFMFSDSARAFAGIGIFLTSGARIAPALLRIQQNILSIKSNLAISYLTVNLITELNNAPFFEPSLKETDFVHTDFESSLLVSEVRFKYDKSESFELYIDNLDIRQGDFLAVVGPSGAGKTTFIDIVLGVIEPDSGKILISGLSPNKVISKWPGAVAYVPQEVFIKEGTIRENIALGYKSEMISSKNIEDALQLVQLKDFVNALPLGIETLIRERGTNLSGGQRQRLGIARALYSKPKILILDEATSSLDGQVEEDITLAISKSLSETIRIVIAHRLSTVRFADKVIYISKGKIIASGSFSEVRVKVPDFDKSAGLLGL